MKKSNKLLLAIVVGVLVIFAGSSLDLHARVKRGAIVVDSVNDDDVVFMIKKYLPSPSYLLVEGVSSILVKASDSFYIEYQKPEAIRYKESIAANGSGHVKLIDTLGIPRCSWKGDSLLINGYDTLPENYPGQKPRVEETNELIIHCRNISLIELRGGSSVSLYGDSSRRHSPTRLLVKDGTLYVAKDENISKDSLAMGYFDTLAIRCVNSEVHVAQMTDIQYLQLDLDSSSAVNELEGNLGRFVLNCSDSAKVSLTGKNIKKLIR